MDYDEENKEFVISYTAQEMFEEIVLFFLCRAGMFPFVDSRIRNGDSPIFWYLRYVIHVGNVKFKDIIPNNPADIQEYLDKELDVMQEKKLISKTEIGFKPVRDYNKFIFTADQNQILHRVLDDMLDTDFLRRF